MSTLLSCPPELLELSPTHWYLIFCEADRRHWWDVVLRSPRQFTHIYAMRWDGFTWIVYNPGAAFTDIEVLAIDRARGLEWLKAGPDPVLEVSAFRHPDRVRGRWWVGPMTCVEQIKALIGLDVGLIFTPWQLYRYLHKLASDQLQTQGRPGDTTLWAVSLNPQNRRKTPARSSSRSDNGATSPT